MCYLHCVELAIKFAEMQAIHGHLLYVVTGTVKTQIQSQRRNKLSDLHILFAQLHTRKINRVSVTGQQDRPGLVEARGLPVLRCHHM
jgi:hypothetical protein